MRLSRPDTEDPSRQRHFEISIDSPFHILSCRATQANMSLPAYTSPESSIHTTDHPECGCPGAPRRRNSPANFPTLSNLRNDSTESTDRSGILPPPAAHVHDQERSVIRPMHLLRAPSFNPPPFSEEDPPPPLVTPPPQYEAAIDGDPRNALADYFARLADELGEDDDEVISNARMEIPLTPGGRINRSMDERRTWDPLGSHVTAT
jgi:arrestin-related trafficking adapter 3/6